MTQQIIDTVTDHGTYKGDPAKVAFEKTNSNFSEVYPLVSSGGKNLLINCGVPINQRGFAGGALAAGTYGYDRWKAGAGGCNLSINATTGVFTHNSGSIQQIVESPQQAWGQALTFSVEGPTGTLTVSIGGATGTITAGSGRRSVTVTPTGSGNMTVQISASGASYSRPQLERGSAATPFDVRPLAVELALCQRYYETSFAVNTAPSAGKVGQTVTASGLNDAIVRTTVTRFAVTKRANPGITLWTSMQANVAGNGWALYNGTTWNSTAQWLVREATNCGFIVDGNYGTGVVQFRCYLVDGNWIADAEI